MRSGLTRLACALVCLLAAPAAPATAATAAPAAAATAAPAAAATTAPLAHAGRWLVDSSGRVVVVHGLNMVAKVAPYTPASTGFGERDARFLVSQGFDVVRLGVIYQAVEPTPGHYDDAYLASIAATVKALGRHGVLTLLDFHQDMFNERFFGEGFPDWAVQDDGLPNAPNNGFPGNLTSMPAVQHAYDHFWADSPAPDGVGLQEHYAAAWRHVAAIFKDSPDVLGYDLFNEPWPGTAWGPCLGPAGCPAFDAELGAMEQRTIRAIRTVDRRHLAFYEPNVLFNFGDPTHLPALGDARAGMSFHDYCLQPTLGCAAAEAKTLANADARAAATHDALLLTEFGSVASDSDFNRMLGYADTHRVPWIEWAYCGCQDPTGAVPPSDEALVLDPHQPPTGSNLVSHRLALLARPYPRAVAGTPLSWSFDPATRAFRLRYSTRRAGIAGSFPSGAQTDVVVPPAAYPRGYHVFVTGARVVSRHSSLLTLAADPGARTVTVRIAG